jgi:formylglycine-generating enzyme required for sulfatase activity
LTQAGVRCHTEAAFALGVPRLLEFERAVQDSRRTLLVLSPAYLADGFTQFTDLLAQTYGLETATWPVIPLILRSVELPPRLAMLTALNATDVAGQAEAVARLCAEAQRPVPGPAPAPPCPYPGMSPFTEADSAHFYGREREVEELLARLRLHPFLAVIGPSGSGKSSLVFAGLIPALRKSQLFGPGGWEVRALRPGEQPLLSLRATMGDLVNAGTLADTDALGRPLANTRLLLVVDQFEELFTVAGAEREPFQQALLRLAETPGCHVVLTVRADFYADLMTALLWPTIQAHRFEVLPLDADGLRQAIARPAENVGVFVESALVERLAADAAGEPGVLPFLQETLNLLWERMERRFLPLRAYEALVLPRRAYGAPPVTGLQVAMARRADAALAQLAAEAGQVSEQMIARRICVWLVHFGEGRADTRRQQPVLALRTAGDDPAMFDRVLEHLARARLLTLSGEAGGEDRRADIAHEALIQGWPTLGEWIRQYREAELMRRRLQSQAENWLRLERQGGLLDRAELAEAEKWLVSPGATGLGIGADLWTFIAASRMAVRMQSLLRWLRPLTAVVVVLALILGGWLGYRGWLRGRAMAGISPVPVAGGTATIGTDDPRVHVISGPAWQVSLPAFTIDAHEATNGQYCLCRRAGGCRNNPSYAADNVCDPKLAAYPVCKVTLTQASEYCAWLGWRLPTEVEWEWAAHGPENRTYPTGELLPGLINLADPNSKDREAWPIDRLGADRTPTGIVGMAGNVREWTVSPWLRYDHPAYRTTFWPTQVPEAEGFVVARGGSFRTGPDSARSVFRYRINPGEPLDDLGFRCVKGLPLEALAKKEVMR